MKCCGIARLPKPSPPLEFLPYGRQQIDAADIEAVVAVLQGDWLTTGPAIARFEEAFATKAGAPHAVSCSSGGAGLHLSFLAINLKPGDRVVVPTVTFLATANMARVTGAEIIFADVDPDTALMTAATLEAAIDRAGGPIAAIAPVHMAGQMVDMEEIGMVARNTGARIVEDACHILGGMDGEGRPAGSGATGDLAVFSMHPVKTIAAGEGGVVTTRDASLAARMRILRNHGMVRENFSDTSQAFTPDGRPNPWYYESTDPGFNYRLSDIHAALAASQLSKLDRFVDRRRALVSRYDAALSALTPRLGNIVRPSGRSSYGSPAWHLYVALIDFAALDRDRASVMEALRERGIGSQVHYLPLHRQPYYRARYGALDLPGADAWYDRALSLPLFPGMSDSDVDRVIETLMDVLEGRA